MRLIQFQYGEFFFHWLMIEYKELESDHKLTVAELNEHGKDNWELVDSYVSRTITETPFKDHEEFWNTLSHEAKAFHCRNPRYRDIYNNIFKRHS